MKLQGVFDSLAHGELSNLAIVSTTTGSIKEAAYPKVVSHINRALREIYKRFLLKKKDCTIYQQTGVVTYYLRNAFVSDPADMGPQAYIESKVDDPFDDDVIRVLHAIDLDTTEPDQAELPLNNPEFPETGVFTNAFDTLHMVPSDPLKRIKLVYQANYPEIVITEDFNPETYSLYFPSFIEEALTNYVASLLIKGKVTKASEGEGYATNTFDYKYEAACQKIILLGLAEEATILSTRFEKRGWV